MRKYKKHTKCLTKSLCPWNITHHAKVFQWILFGYFWGFGVPTLYHSQLVKIQTYMKWNVFEQTSHSSSCHKDAQKHEHCQCRIHHYSVENFSQNSVLPLKFLSLFSSPDLNYSALKKLNIIWHYIDMHMSTCP